MGKARRLKFQGQARHQPGHPRPFRGRAAHARLFSLRRARLALALVAILALALALGLGWEALVRALGLGLAPALAWALGGATVLLAISWSGRLGWALRPSPEGLRRWRLAPALALFTLALLGGLSFLSLQETLWGVSLGKEATGGGTLGQALGGGGAWGGLKVAALALGGLIFLSPPLAWRLARTALRGLRRAYRAYPLDILGTRLMVRLGRLWPIARRLRPRAPPLPRVRRPQPQADRAAQAPSSKERQGARESKPHIEPQATPPPPAVPVAPPRPAPEPALPSLSLLDRAPEPKELSRAANEERAHLIEEALASYGVDAKVVQVNPGPVVTQFAVEPGWDRKLRKVAEKGPDGRPLLDRNGSPRVHQEEVSRTRVKVERITSLANDLALALAAPSIRIEAPVPGQGVVGIEVPNATFSLVPLRTVVESSAFQRLKSKSKLALALGKGAGGEAVVSDLARMPHLLIAGATGSGKTVCIHSILASLLLHATPSQLRLLLIDPKRVELTAFNPVPHLITPVVVEREAATTSLQRVVQEMEGRYRKLAQVGARNIEAYNRHPRVLEPLPYLVVVIDEMADLMMAAVDVVEPVLCRLAQLARATGIHLVVATQRPSVDVVTGLIKANFPCRISFAVASQVDSRTILDGVGAEKLLGKGDMLFMPAEAEKPKRLQGSFITDAEIERVVNFWREWRLRRHLEPLADAQAQAFASLPAPAPQGGDPLLEEARRLAAGLRHISASLLQRRLRIGYPRAARLMDLLEEEGAVGPAGDETPQPASPGKPAGRDEAVQQP